jgi:hypothetical protein
MTSAGTTKSGNGGNTGSDPGSSGQHPGTSVGLLTPIELQTARLDALLDAVEKMLKTQIAAAEKCVAVVADMRAHPQRPPDKTTHGVKA